MEKLPLELYRPIIQHLDKKADIAHLLRCSKTFQRECEPILYAEILLKQVTPHHLFHLTRNPRTAILIKSLTFLAIDLKNVPVTTNGNGFQTCDTNSPCGGSLRPSLKVLPNLKSLKLGYFPTGPPSMSSLFDDVTFKLHRFSCPYPCDADVIRFFRGQDQLRTLEWHASGRSGAMVFPSNILLNLTSIHANGNVITCIVPGRAISRVHHDTYQQRVYDLPLLLSRSSARIEALVLGWLRADRNELESWKHHLSDLRFLQCLIGRKNQSLIYTILPSLTKLTKLVLNGTGDGDDLLADESFQLVAKVFELAPSLHVVDRDVKLPPDSEDYPMVFLRWTRGGGEPVTRDTFPDVDEWLYY